MEIESDILYDAVVMYSQSSRCATDLNKNQCLNPVTESGCSRGRRYNKVTSAESPATFIVKRRCVTTASGCTTFHNQKNKQVGMAITSAALVPTGCLTPSADPDPFLVHGLVVGDACPRETLSRFIPWK